MAIVRINCGCEDAPCCGCNEVAYTGQDALDQISDDEAADILYGENDDDFQEDGMTDVEADADTLASAGYGTDEDYRGYEYADEDQLEADCGDF